MISTICLHAYSFIQDSAHPTDKMNDMGIELHVFVEIHMNAATIA